MEATNLVDEAQDGRSSDVDEHGAAASVQLSDLGLRVLLSDMRAFN